MILDAPCGTGRYFEKVLAAGRTVVGMNWGFEGDFDGAMCIDAMEYVFPEDWPLVLRNLHKAVRGRGHIYPTVEQVDEAEIASVFAEASAERLPIVYGENLRRGGYHYYPSPDRVSAWLEDEGLEIVDEGVRRGRTYSYLHLLVQ